jgi:hypothetical protein
MPPISQHSTQLSIGAIVLSTISILTNPNGAAAVTITYEAPNVFEANTAVIGSTAVNTFETGTVSKTPVAYTFDFQDATTTNNYRATYDKLVVANYGDGGTPTAGAGYTGKFAVNSNLTALTDPLLPTTKLTFTDTTQNGISAGVKYFGIFFSSLDPGNQLTFYNGNAELAKVSIDNFGTLVGNATPFIGGPFTEPGAFFNFYAGANEEFTRIEFTQTTSGGGFENDNHTFRIPNAVAISGSGVNLAGLTFTGNVTSTPIPEPLTIIGSIIGGTAALGMRKKLKSTQER